MVIANHLDLGYGKNTNTSQNIWLGWRKILQKPTNIDKGGYREVNKIMKQLSKGAEVSRPKFCKHSTYLVNIP